MSSDLPVIQVNNLSKCYEVFAQPSDRLKEILISPLRDFLRQSINRLFGVEIPPHRYFEEFWALRGINLEVRPGETLGIIGRNGSGKSTLLQVIAGTLTPTSGDVEVRGRVAALLELGSGFNPEFTGRENVLLSGQILGLTRKEIEDRFEAIARFADIGEFIDQPVKTYSSGMFVRLAFAVHAHIDASIVIIDEALAVGDIFFRQKCYQRLEELRTKGAAIILVSHSMPDIEQYCERAIVLDRGKIHFSGGASEAARHYYLLHQPQGISPEASGTRGDSEINRDLGLKIDWEFPDHPRCITESKNQIGTGQAHCLSVTLVNDNRCETSLFRQGDHATFYYDFVIDRPLDGVPVVGILIKNERGIIVHGKNSWQFESTMPSSLEVADRIICRHEVSLSLGLGDYIYEVGLSMVPLQLWQNRDRVSHEEMTASEHRICHVPDAGMFSISIALKDQVPKLTHHGVADLEGGLWVGCAAADDGVTAHIVENSVLACGNRQSEGS
jgi:lipopolysaccharide transport system ATP-binding protein